MKELTTNKHGLDRLMLVVYVTLLLESKDSPKIESSYNEFVNVIEDGLKRKLTSNEIISLNEGLIKLVKSKPETNERFSAIDYIQNAEFILTPPANGQRKID